MVKFVILMTKNTEGCIFEANEPVVNFNKNRLVAYQVITIAIFIVKFAILILKSTSGFILTVNGQSSIFRKNLLVGSQDLRLAILTGRCTEIFIFFK